MAETASADALDAALSSDEVRRGEAAGFWQFVERAGHVVYFDLYAWDGDKYRLELTCDRLGEDALQGRFVDPANRQCVSAAWPKGDAVFAGWIKWTDRDLFICWPGDRRGIGRHTNWRCLKHWSRTENQLHQYLDFIRKCLNIRSYGYKPRNQR